MNRDDILAICDHTLLKPDSTWDDIRLLCDEAVEFGTASVCIPPCHVRAASDYCGDRMAVCTVVGFPNGNATTAAKVFEAEDAVANGAAEIDMVINIGMVKSEEYSCVLEEIKQIRSACRGRILKVIIETCLLSAAEKLKLCEAVSASGADFIKTSTGFSSAGATFEDVALMSKHVSGIKIKAAGGISSFADAERFVELGASRLGTSRLVKISKGERT